MGRLGVVVVLAVVACASAITGLARGGQRSAVTNASLAYTEMQHRFAFADGRYAASDTRHSWAHLWPLSQALTAGFEFGSVPGRSAAAARADALRTVETLSGYRDGQGYESLLRSARARSGNVYYDDNNWIALDLVAAYRLSGRQAFLTRAEGVFQFLVSGWDTNGGDACPGGVLWAEPPLPQVRTTVSTANAALVALRLYEATGRHSYLAWAQRMYGWVRSCLGGRNGLYYDHVDAAGTVGKHEWTYNQGAMIAAGVLLARATGQRTYLDQARATARAALTRYGRSGYAGEPPIFVAIFFGDLNVLEHVARLPALHHYLRRHVALRPNGHFGSSLVFQAAAVQLYSLAATPG